MTTRTLSKNLYKAMRAVKNTLPRDLKKLPILNCARFSYHEGRIALTSMTYEKDTLTPVTEYASCIWEGDTWETYVPMKPFTDWLRVTASYGEVLELSYDPQREVLQIKADNTRAEFRCINAQEFPAHLSPRPWHCNGEG